MSLEAATRPSMFAEIEPTSPGAIDDAQVQARARIVIVDDEPLNSGELEAFLRSLGYRNVVTVVPDATTPDAVRHERPDLILLELALRGPTAFDVLGWIGADRVLRHVPVVAITAQDERPTRLRALKLGASDYLVKPIDPIDLELRLRNMLATKIHHDRLAYTDSLTGLPNRESSLHRLDWALKFARRQNVTGAVLQVGLDRFKQVNDALGPALGDELLRAVALRLLTCLRSTDVVTRDHPVAPEAEVTRGDGDEFTVMLPVLAHSGDAAMVADRIVEAMAEPFQLARHELFVTCQIGIAVFAGGTQDKDTVLRQAKLAMRHARSGSHGGGSSVRVYSQELHGRSSSRLTLERELHHALERNELVLHFQPKVDVAADRLCGVEAMVRWNHPQRGLLGPGAFIDVAEESGLVVPMGDWVLNEALRQAVDWRQRGMPPLPVAVNVSSLQLRRPHLDRTVSDALARAGLEGSALCLELTESVMMETGLTVTNALHAIKELGVHLALDDFGTGYSSLSYLRRFPIDELKIDRSFIVECQAANNSATVITEAIIAMAHGLRLRVVAEGVETEQQLDFLRSTGCDQYQGFLFSKAVPAEEFETLFSHVGGVAHRMAAARPVFDPRLTTAAVEFEQFSATEMGTLLPD